MGGTASIMASRATHAKPVDWRAAFRRSATRAGEIALAVLIAGFTLFLALSLVSYTSTDPSPSTAAGVQDVGNWLGLAGAWLSDRALMLFGVTVWLLLPMLYICAMRLWQAAEHPDRPDQGRWWRPFALLLLAMLLLGSALTLALGGTSAALPARIGGLVGLLGELAIGAITARFPVRAQGWVAAGLGVASLATAIVLLIRVFAIDWRRFFVLPDILRRRAVDAPDDLAIPGSPERAKPRQIRAAADGDEADEKLVPAPPRRSPEISDPSSAPRPAAARPAQRDMFTQYELPAIDLLEPAPQNKATVLDKMALERNARLLENVLDDFNVKGEITAVRTGPVVTMYELEPAPGIKASRVVGLAEDIARNMSAVSARVSPIPGKTVMGIELPNADRQTVSYRELVASADFAEAKGGLPMILGKDIAGEPIVADLAAMPHLLVAGTTGSGKSVGLNAILLSLLYRFTPAECRLILIDPKVLELKTYDDIPHLLSPVVTEPHKSVRALKWAVEEMERRYRMMSAISSRNIVGFNEKVRAAQAKGKPLGRRVQTGFDPETGEELYEEEQLDYQALPLIVLIVDELADLMVTVGKEIEVLIQRLSQKSRAAGIHLIMATQRPSVDVITGVIKANLPTRISFKVTSRIDSRTILGEQGAEQLLGKGDMLYKPNTGAMVRVHGPFVADEEVERVADHWRAQGKPEYVDAVTEEPEEGAGFDFEDEFTASDNPEERKYRQACQIVIENQKASGSWLQRQMGVGYNTAAKWIERMEGEGLVGPANHVGRREIFRDQDGNPL